MPIKKRVLCAERLRRVPEQFSWVDQHLVRHRYIQRCDHSDLALYLVLVTVCDAEGLSYYSDRTLERMLRIDSAKLAQSRRRLCELGLIAYQNPLYQVLSLEEPLVASSSSERAGQTLSVKELLQNILQKGAQP